MAKKKKNVVVPRTSANQNERERIVRREKKMEFLRKQYLKRLENIKVVQEADKIETTDHKVNEFIV